MDASDELRSLEATGIYRLAGSRAAFVDPVRLLGESYRRFRLVPSAYYSRSFGPSRQGGEAQAEGTAPSPDRKKRKRKRQTKARELNAVERIAEARHQEARPLLISAHNSLLDAKYLLEYLPGMIKGDECRPELETSSENNFVELGGSWRAPFYEMTICFQKPLGQDEAGTCDVQKRSSPLFNRVVRVEENGEAEGEFQGRLYVLPKGSCFMTTDFTHVRDLIPDNPNTGYNLIVIDPPWENGCVRQKEAYPTLPNRNLLYLPVQELAHPAGALVVLWITNREKLRRFVEEELLPSWGVKDPTEFYWLKVKSDGSLIGDLDLFHHRPYECLLLGYINVNREAESGSKFKVLQGSQVIMSVPGAHSRKPPLQKILSEYIPGPKPPRCIELFARELGSGWTSWGNEPLHFQDSAYFSKK
ncbi:methyltransferase-like protein 2 [Aegilops tauschii subsp. strangulata]|uniref:Methyltransferase-like protein 2 n=3 Tax=Aegilops tauschii subsp. strangulata TaxID=200361 RepID=A0A453IR03_AEGTS|nr:methyltransferase-like protein 2 [Aegilops tauschii subsp. strangulata]